MPSAHIVKQIDIQRTARVMQVEGIFDMPPSQRSEQTWHVQLELPETWHIGLIVGPSGSGKSTVARELFGASIVERWDWPDKQSVLDGFPVGMGIKDITALLSSVGFSSPPSWLRPYHVLSNGEKFRVDIARTLAEQPELAVIDEFTSVVDRTVAQIGSAAVQKAVRRRGQQLIAVSCHYDIIDWLEPDWVYEPHTNEFRVGRSLWRRPTIELEVQRVHHSAWQLFRQHHYLDTNLNTSAICFVAFWQSVPVAFSAWLHFMHPKHRKTKREHRTVTLPDYQGVGIGNALSDYLSGMWRALDYRVISTTSNPAMVRSRNASQHWSMQRKASRTSAGSDNPLRGLSGSRASGRLSSGFEYIGPALPADEAHRLMGLAPTWAE